MSDEPKPTGQVLKSVGYGTGLQQNAHRVLNSDGFEEALASTGLRQALEAEGINGKRIAEKINVLLDARNGDKDDYTAIDKGLKHATAIYGITEPKPQGEHKTIYNYIFAPQTQVKIREMDNEIKKHLTKPHVQENPKPMESERVQTNDNERG